MRQLGDIGEMSCTAPVAVVLLTRADKAEDITQLHDFGSAGSKWVRRWCSSVPSI